MRCFLSSKGTESRGGFLNLEGHTNRKLFDFGIALVRHKPTLHIYFNMNIPAGRNPRSRFAAFLKNFAFHLSETHIESPKNLPNRALSFRGVFHFAEAKRNSYRPFPAFSFFTSLRSLRQFAAPHLTGARHSAAAKTLHTRGDAGCTKPANSGHML